jgi:DMSO reductase anchor subunit
LIGLPSLGALGIGAFAEWLGGVQGAPHAVLIGAVILGVILVFVMPMFWKRDLPQRKI